MLEQTGLLEVAYSLRVRHVEAIWNSKMVFDRFVVLQFLDLSVVVEVGGFEPEVALDEVLDDRGARHLAEENAAVMIADETDLQNLIAEN